jgi:hypothetical protein
MAQGFVRDKVFLCKDHVGRSSYNNSNFAGFAKARRTVPRGLPEK